MARFSIITLSMIVLLGMSYWQGGLWSWLSLVYITVFTFFMDKITALTAPDMPEGAEFPAGKTLSVALGLFHFPLLFGGVAVLSSQGATLLADKILIFLALSLFLGQVSNSNAHELIHRSNRRAAGLGKAVYCSVLFGHHCSAHLHVHHVHAATGSDPNSAHFGESFYHFAWRAWRGSFRDGLKAETRRRDRKQNGQAHHPYLVYLTGAGLSLGLAAVIGGVTGLGALVALSIYAQVQLLLSDYVQHYGLRRKKLDNDKHEPVGPQHSWNAPNWFSSALMLNAPRHSDHHAHPARPYTGLRLDQATMPILPHSLPVMAVLALWPPLWRQVMDPRVNALTAKHCANANM